MNEFREIHAKEIGENPFKLIGEDWMLVTSGDQFSYNTMTASWGGVGVMWAKDVAYVVIRPQRHTFGFVEKNDCLSLCFFDSEYKATLNYCGAHSGREVDKAKETGLTPIFDEKTVYFSEAKLVMQCKKLYAESYKPECFFDKKIITDKYPNSDFHKMYICEIEKVFVK